MSLLQRALHLLLLVTFALTVAEPLTGPVLHAHAGAVFCVLAAIHFACRHERHNVGSWALLGIVAAALGTGLWSAVAGGVGAVAHKLAALALLVGTGAHLWSYRAVMFPRRERAPRLEGQPDAE